MDDAAFTTIDRSLFERLHWGALGPIVLRLKDGATVRGDVLGVSRSGATGRMLEAPGGEIRILSGGTTLCIPYEQIHAIE